MSNRSENTKMENATIQKITSKEIGKLSINNIIELISDNAVFLDLVAVFVLVPLEFLFLFFCVISFFSASSALSFLILLLVKQNEIYTPFLVLMFLFSLLVIAITFSLYYSIVWIVKKTEELEKVEMEKAEIEKAEIEKVN